MSVFIGDFACKADAKGRIVLPAAFKRVMEQSGEDRFVLKKDLFENCLVLYPFSEWEKLMTHLREGINLYKKEEAIFFRNFQRDSADLQLDGNGRFLIPRRLADSVGIDKDAVLLGVDRHIEIWSEKELDKQSVSQDELGLMAEKFLGR